MNYLNQNDILENEDSNYKLRRLKEVKKRQKLQKKEQKLDKENYIKLFTKQNKYLKNMNYAKVLPLSLFHPNIDFINLGSSILYIRPIDNTIMEELRFKLNNMFFQDSNKIISIYNVSQVTNRIEILNKRPSNNYGFKFKFLNNKIYAIRETFNRYIINEKDFIQVLNQFDSFWDNKNEEDGKTLFVNQYLKATDSANYVVPVSITNFTPEIKYLKNNRKEEHMEEQKTSLLQKISMRLRNIGKTNSYIMEVTTHNPTSIPRKFNPTLNKYFYHINKEKLRLELIHIGKYHPMYFKYRDSTILGLTKNQNSDYYNIDTRKNESTMEYNDIASFLTFYYLSMNQLYLRNYKIINNNIDMSLLLSYKDVEQEKYIENIHNMVNYINYIQSNINENIKDYYNKYAIKEYGKNYKDEEINLKYNLRKYVTLNRSIFPHKALTNKTRGYLGLKDVACYDNMSNFGMIIQVLPSEYEQKYSSMDYNRRINNRFEELITKEVKNNINIGMDVEYLQVSKTQYCAVYFDNVRKKVFYFSPNIANPIELLKKKLLLHNIQTDYNDNDRISNKYSYLSYGIDGIQMNKSDRSLNFKLYDDVKEENKFKDDKIINSLFFDKLNNNELSLEDISGLYCLYFLVVMSSTMTDINDIPISSLDDPFTDYFDEFFKYFKHNSFKPTSERESIEERKRDYLNHVSFISDYIGDMLFTGLNQTYGKTNREIDRYKKTRQDLKESMEESIYYE